MPSVGSGQITPGTGQISYEDNVPTATSTLSSSAATVQYLLSVLGSNVGSGNGIYAGYSGNQNVTLFFKSLAEGENINIVETNDTVTFSADMAFTGLLDTPGTITTNGILYGSGTNALSYITAPVSSNQVLTWNGTAFVWSYTGSGTVQIINVVGNNGITVSGSPITTNGTISLGLSTTGASAGTYFAPTMSVDAYGRVLSIQSEMEAPLVGIATVTNTYSGSLPVYAGLGSQIAKFVSIDALAPLSGTMSGDSSTILLSLSNSGVTAGTYNNILVNSHGLITSMRGLLSSDIVTVLGYTPVQGTPSISATPSTLALRDTSGNIAANTFVGNLIGNASTASALQNSVNIILTGDATGTTSFNGSVSASIAVTLDTTGVTPGTYNTVLVDGSGRVLVGYNVVGDDGVTLTGDVIGSGVGTFSTSLVTYGTVGTYTKVVTDAKGRVASGSELVASDVTLALGFTPVSTASLGVASGVATLDVTGKLTLSQLPASVSGALVYQGTWNASTNSPPLVSSNGTKGNYYKVSVAGSTTLNGISSWNVGDTVVFDGTTWDKIDGLANEVISVAGRTGVVTLAVTDVSGAAPLASPALTGVPTAPTAAVNTATTQIATTSFVVEQIVTSATLTATGDVTGTGLGSVTLTLATTGVTPGTYNAVVVDSKGRVISANNVTSTTDVTLTGDVTGSGVGSIATTLAATGVTAGTYTSVVVNTKGLVVSASQLTSANVVSALGFTPLGAGSEGIANGLATLDSGGKIPLSQLPDAIAGAVQYQGTWNAASNTPTLASGVGTLGYYYKVSVAGTTNLDGKFQWNIGDLAIFDGTTWDKIDGLPSEVTSVAGRVGAVTLSISDISGGAPLASPALTGNPTAPNPLLSDSSTSVATTYFVKQQNYITTNKTITVSGDASGSGTTAITLTLASTGVTPGTYASVVVDSKGRVTSGSATSGSSLAQSTYSYQVNFDSSGNITSVADMPSGWSYTIVSANELTITHGLGLFPQSVVCFGYNSGLFTMKTPNGNPTGQFSIGVTSMTDTPNTFTMYGVNSTAVNAAASSYMIVQVLI